MNFIYGFIALIAVGAAVIAIYMGVIQLLLRFPKETRDELIKWIIFAVIALLFIGSHWSSACVETRFYSMC